MAEKMNEGDLGEMMVMVGIIETPTGPKDVLILDTMNTRGIPNNNCCGRDPN